MSKDIRFNAMKWCLDNNIKIYAVTDLSAPTYGNGKFKLQKVKIQINYKGQIKTLDLYYKQEDVTEEIFKIYIKYYERV